MSLLHPSSGVATVKELDLFDMPLTQTAIENIYYLDVRPMSTITANSVVEFVMGGEGRDYIDLARSRLYVKMRILHQDGSSITTQALKTDGTPDPAGTTDEEVVPVNLALHAMWNQIDVYINGSRMSQSSGMYPFKAMIQTQLGYGSDAKDTQLKAQGYRVETGGDMEGFHLTNEGLYWRYQLFKGSKSVDFEGPLLEDVLQLNRYLLNNMKVQIKLYPSQKQFFIMSEEATKDYKVEIQDIVFKACMVKVNPSVILGHAKAMETRNALYPYTKYETKSYSVSPDQRTVYLDNLFQGIRPSKLVIAMVGASAFNGDYKKNPFNFKHFDISNIALVVDGDTVPGRPLKLDFTVAGGGRQFIEGYVNMYEALGQSGTDFGGGITPKTYAQGHTLFVYSLDPVIRSGKYINLTKHSNVRLEMNFAKPLPETVTVIVYTESPAVFEVDVARNIILPNN
jgi:hypothetical protein